MAKCYEPERRDLRCNFKNIVGKDKKQKNYDEGKLQGRIS